MPLARSTKSGMTCLVLPDGSTEGVLDTFVQAWGIYEVPIYSDNGPTFYTRHPDLVGKLYVVAAAAAVGVLIIYNISKVANEKRRKRQEEEERLSKLFVSMDEKVEC